MMTDVGVKNNLHFTHQYNKDTLETRARSEHDESRIVHTHVETNERSPRLVVENKEHENTALQQGPNVYASNDGAQDDDMPSATLSSATSASPLANFFAEINNKRGKPDAPKFLLLLYEILRSESDKVICWSEDGLALQILDQNAVTVTILPKYFNHTNFHSFQRQLNYFGFRKWTKSKTDICTFSHMYFRRHQPELLSLIKRKKAPRRNALPDMNKEIITGGNRDLSAIGGGAISRTSPLKRTLLPLRNKRALSPHPQYINDKIQIEQSSYGQSPTNSIVLQIGADGSTTNAISPVAAGGAKKKARKGPSLQEVTFKVSTSSPPSNDENRLYTKTIPETTSSSQINNGKIYLPTLDQQVQSQVFSNIVLPNFDIVRNGLMVRQATTAPVADNTTAASTLPFGKVMNPQKGHSPSTPTIVPCLHVPTQCPSGKFGSVGSVEVEPRSPTSSVPLETSSTTSTTQKTSSNAFESTNLINGDESSPRFNNSFSDPVDILLRIKKSRALSSDTTNPHVTNSNVNNNGIHCTLSSQSQQDQADNLASLQNFLLSQSLYTNQLEAQLKLSSDENEALRQLLDAKIREVDALQNERKTLQNENSVLMEGKNKLFEINRDLLSKLL